MGDGSPGVLLLQSGDPRWSYRHSPSNLERGASVHPVTVTATDPRPLPQLLASAAQALPPGDVLLLHADEAALLPWLIDGDVPSSQVFAPAPDELVRNPLSLPIRRWWSRDELVEHATQTPTLEAAPHEPTGRVLPPRRTAAWGGSDREWARGVAHLRELARGVRRASPQEAVLDAEHLAWAGHHDAAFVRVVPVARDVAADPDLRRRAARTAVGTALAVGRVDDAVDALALWAEVDESPALAAWTAFITVISPDHAGYVAATPRLARAVKGPDGGAVDPGLPGVEGEWLARAVPARGRRVVVASRQQIDAALSDELFEPTPQIISEAFALWCRSGRSPDGFVAAWPAQLAETLRAFVRMPPGTAVQATLWDVTAHALVERFGWGDGDLVPAITAAAQFLDLRRLVPWEEALVQNSVPRSVLVERSQGERVPATDRVLAAAVAGDSDLVSAERLRALVRAAVRHYPVDHLTRLIELVDDVAPSVVPVTIDVVAEDPHSAGVLADMLDGLGMAEIASELRARATGVPLPDDDSPRPGVTVQDPSRGART